MVLSMISVMLVTRLDTGDGLFENSEGEEDSPSEGKSDPSEVRLDTGMGEGKTVLQMSNRSNAPCNNGTLVLEYL